MILSTGALPTDTNTEQYCNPLRLFGIFPKLNFLNAGSHEQPYK